MASSVDAWIAKLREYTAECRAKAPLPDWEHLTAAQEWQRRIVGGSILNWLRQIGPRFLQERAIVHRTLQVDPHPAIVFTSNVPGLVAAQEIVGPDHERGVYLLEEEFAAAPAHLADGEYKCHIRFWSFFRAEPEPAFAARARAKYPLADGGSYWQHSEGTMWAVNAGRGVDHLWRWDGQQAVLL